MIFLDGFPRRLAGDVIRVTENIPFKTYNFLTLIATEHGHEWRLLSGEKIYFPDRIYLVDCIENLEEVFTPLQQIIYHCIFSRSCDGYIRQKHIAQLLNMDIPNWAIPYVLKVCDEYVVEILELVYHCIKNTDTAIYEHTYSINPEQLRLGYQRVISYWNEYYRRQYPSFNDYVGKVLYDECFGYKH